MPDISAGETIQLRVWTEAGEQAAVNTFYFKCQAVTGFVSDIAITLQFDTAIAAVFKPLLQNVAVYRGTQGRIMKTPPPVAVIADANPGPGTAGAVGLPRQTCGIYTKRTALAGRGYRGRMYLPFPAVDDDQGGGGPTLGYMAKLDNLTLALDAFTHVVDVPGSDATLVQVLWKGKAVSPVPIVANVPNQKWATQRRRGSYGKANVVPF